eukprot:1395426-Amorphochlora_amoeboformis.AAC.2
MMVAGNDGSKAMMVTMVAMIVVDSGHDDRGSDRGRGLDNDRGNIYRNTHTTHKYETSPESLPACL